MSNTEEQTLDHFRELQQQIKELEMELEWAENQEPEDYKFITKLDKQIESLYRELDEIG
jgi:SPX domain protein involved in polyphosphate accumulation